MCRLFAARISFESNFEEDGLAAQVTEYMQVARRTVYWWSPKQPEQATLWQSYVELDIEFFLIKYDDFLFSCVKTYFPKPLSKRLILIPVSAALL